MPYSIRAARGGGYDIINKDTGKKVGHSSSKQMAQASIRARYANEKKGGGSNAARRS